MTMDKKEEICCWDFGHNEDHEFDLHYLNPDKYKVEQTMEHITEDMVDSQNK